MHMWETLKENRFVIVAVMIMLIVGIGYMVFFQEKEENLLLNNEDSFIETGKEQTNIVASDMLEEEKIIIVDVKGAVHNPGVYELYSDSRVKDALEKAGGALPDADLEQVNLAAFLIDGQVVYIPQHGEEVRIWQTQSSTNDASVSSDSKLININTATEIELQSLPGIGPSKAQAIIRFREEHGKFEKPTDLLKVTGIGEKTLEKLLPLITVK